MKVALFTIAPYNLKSKGYQMKAIVFTLLALFVYAIANTTIEKKLSGISPLANTTYIYVILLAISLPILLFRNQLGLHITMPDTSQTWIIAGVAILFFFADLAWFKAYHSDGRLEQISAVFLAFPIITAMMKAASSGVQPTKSDVLSWVIVAIGLIVSIRQPLK